MLSVGTIHFEKVGQGEVGVTQRVTCMVAADCKIALVSGRWAIVLLSCTNRPRKHSFRLVGAPFLTF